MSGDARTGPLSGYAVVTAVQALATVAAVSLFTRLLDPAAYGCYALALATALFLQAVLFHWLHAGMVRFYESARTDAAALASHLATLWTAFALGASAVAVMTIIGAGWFGPLAYATGLYLVARAGLSLTLEQHRMAGRVRRYAALEICQSTIGIATGGAIAVATPLDGAAPLFGMAAGCGVALLADGRQIVAALRGRISRRHLGMVLAYGLPMGLATLMHTVSQQLDRFLVAGLLDEAAAGIYAVAYATGDRPMALIFGWLGMAAWPPILAAFERRGQAAAEAEMDRLGRLMLLVGIPAAVGLGMVGKPLAALLVGAQFSGPVAALLPLIAAAALLNGIVAYYLAVPFVLQRRSGRLAALMGGTAVVGAALNLALIPLLGLWGAALASVLAFAITAAVGYGLVRPWVLTSGLLRHGLRCTAAAAVMAAALAWLPLPDGAAGLAVAVPVGMIVYGLVAWLLGASAGRGNVLLAVEATLALAVARAAVALLPFRLLAGSTAATQPPPGPADLAKAGRVARALAGMVPRLPWHSTCLVRALAGRWMLRRRRVDSLMRIGVAKQGGGIEAHAWLTVGDMVVSDGAEAGRFTPIGGFRG